MRPSYVAPQTNPGTRVTASCDVARKRAHEDLPRRHRLPKVPLHPERRPRSLRGGLLGCVCDAEPLSPRADESSAQSVGSDATPEWRVRDMVESTARTSGTHVSRKVQGSDRSA